MARAGRAFLLKPARPIYRHTAEVIEVIEVPVDLGAVTMSAAATFASGDLTVTGNDIGAVTMSAAATFASGDLTGVLTVDLGAVSMSAALVIGAAGEVTGPVDLGAVTIPVVATTAVAGSIVVQQGTLANPYPALDSDSFAVDFNTALFVPAEPTVLSGPVDAPSVWYVFTEGQAANWVASTSGFAHGATIELYLGPPGAGADDLTFMATDGVASLDLGSVAVSVGPAVEMAPMATGVVDLGVVELGAAPVLAGALT